MSIKKFILIVLFLSMLLVQTTNVSAEPYSAGKYDYETDTAILSTQYSRMMSSSLAPYLIASQPDTAIIINNGDNITVTEDLLSPNYVKGAIDLPRLSRDYYYTVTGDGFSIPATIYPVLLMDSESLGQSCTLRVYSTNELTPLIECSISVPSDFAHTADSDTFVDCSKGLLNRFLADDATVDKINTSISIYDSRLHKTAIIMPNYCIMKDFVTDVDFLPAVYSGTVTATAIDIKKSAAVFNHYGDSTSFTTNYNIKDYTAELSRGSARPALLFGGSLENEYCSFDNNTGIASTAATIPAPDLYTFYALTDDIYFQAITGNQLRLEDLKDVKEDSTVTYWNSGEFYSVLDYEDVQKYGPLVLDTWWTKTGLPLTKNGFYKFMYDSNTTVNNVNVFGMTCMYNGVVPNLLNLTLTKEKHTVSIRYMQEVPLTGELVEVATESYDVDELINSTKSLLDVGSLKYIADGQPDNNWKYKGWYTNNTYNSLFSLNMLDTERDSSLTLYAKADYTGDDYTVTFYNDQTGVQTTSTFHCYELPKLPDNPESIVKGVRFLNWKVVANASDNIGEIYSPDNFKPTANKNYIFKTNWDTFGIIVEVTTAKYSYYIGDRIDLSSLNVIVQTDNAGNTRTLNSSEFTVAPEAISTVGANRFTVTYTTTGATAICEVEGLSVKETGITASYNGSDLVVGSSLPSNLFNVTMKYSNGTELAISNFTVSPNRVLEVGNNVVTIKSGEFSTTVTVKGISTETTDSRKTLESITASYLGTNELVGSSVNTNRFNVIANYSDGSRRGLGSNEYDYTPSVYNAVGNNKIRITYGGKSTTLTVPVVASSSGGNSNNNNNGNNSNNSNNITRTELENAIKDAIKNQMSTKTHNDNNKTDTSNNSNKNNDSTNNSTDNSANDNESDEKGPSPIYLSGATILTNTMTAKVGQVQNTVDISKVIDEAASNATSTSVTLVNGAVGNDITQDMMRKLSDKKLTLNVRMVSPEDENITVGNWEIRGAQLSDTYSNLNPNINYEIVDSGDSYETLLYMSLQGQPYPEAVSCSIIPLADTYSYGSVVRTYQCDSNLDNAFLVNTTTWSDTNTFNPNLNDSIIYCMSNANELHVNGSNLKSTFISNSVSGNSVSGNDTDNTDTDAETVEIDSGSDDYIDIEYDHDSELEDTGKEGVKSTAKVVITIVSIACLLTVVIIIGIIALLNHSKKGKIVNTNQEKELNEEYYDDSDYPEDE